jgi:xanthine/uracil permease
VPKLDLKYGLENKPPFGELILLGLQWLAITIPVLIIIGKVVADLQFDDLINQVNYLQKLSFVVGVALLCQVLWGHRLPLVVGPAGVLLIGIVAVQSYDFHTIYTSIFIGGVILFLLGISGLFGRLVKLFTPRVVATILLLIAFTLSPTILDLIVNSQQPYPLLNICFALGLVLCGFVADRCLPGIWKSTLIIWLVIAGSLIYFLISPLEFHFPKDNLKVISFFFPWNFRFSFDPGVLTAFLFCFLALSINDMGSIQSVGEMLHCERGGERLSRGIALTGLTNVLSGLSGVIGMVNFSLSPGVIASTGCASRFTLIPTAVGLLILSFFPSVIAFMGTIPGVVIGSILLYLMSTQIAAGLMVAVNTDEGITFEGGLVMGLPLMLGIIISFLPQEVSVLFPVSLRPILANGFVMGSIAVLILEHIVFKK